MNEQQRNWEVYPGKRKAFNWVSVAVIVLVLLAGSLVLLFSSFQKYLVYRQDGVYLDLPFLESSTEELTDIENVVREPVQAELSLDGYDFSNVQTNAGENISTLKAMYVTYDQINDDSLQNYVSRAELNNASALVLQVKPENGQLVYPSKASLAAGYGLSGTYDLATKVISLKEQGMYLVADVTCMLDSTIVTRYMGTALGTATGILATEAGYWMDPYNTEYRQYLVEVCKELIGMGFDEIMLSYVSHPVAEGVIYSQTMTTTPTADVAISSFAIYMEKELGDLVPLSLRCSYDALTNGLGSNGQNMEVLGKVFDRIFCSADKNTYDTCLEKAKQYMNTTNANRFVPYGYSAPTDNSWMLLTWVDTGE